MFQYVSGIKSKLKLASCVFDYQRNKAVNTVLDSHIQGNSDPAKNRTVEEKSLRQNMETGALQNSFDTVDMKAMPEKAGKSTNPFEEFCAHQRRKQIWNEFEHIVEHPISGLYVFPSLKSLQVWHGVLFVNEGLYAEGIFYFHVILDDEYPHSYPTIRFTSNMMHPRVTKKGNLNITCPLPNEGNECIWKALEYTKDCFYKVDLPDTCNNDSLQRVNGSKDYKALIRGCVLESLYEFQERALTGVQDDFETDNPFDSHILSEKSYELAKNSILNQYKTKSDKGSVYYWTKTAIGKLWDSLPLLTQE